MCPSNIDKIQQSAQVELRSTVVRSGPPILIPYNDKYNHTGFTSMYGYTDAAVDWIKTTKSTRELSKFQVYSDVLYVDFDNNEKAAKEFAVYLKLKNYTNEIYDSGGRSIHFHIPITPMFGYTVPQSQKMWMQEHAPEADMSIYKHTGLYRLPGTYHNKNAGNKKIWIDGIGGQILTIENRPTVQIPRDVSGDTPEEANRILGRLLHMKISEGGRHPHAYNIVRACKGSGRDKEYARKLLNMWNDDNCYPPKAEHELEKLLRWEYGV
jgi:hypothetical protein